MNIGTHRGAGGASVDGVHGLSLCLGRSVGGERGNQTERPGGRPALGILGQGVAGNRQLSVLEPDLWPGNKGPRHFFDGYKALLSLDPDSHLHKGIF